MENVEKAKALAAAQRTLEGVVAKALEVRRKVEERELHRAGQSCFTTAEVLCLDRAEPLGLHASVCRTV
jgi:hypothetical protein